MGYTAVTVNPSDRTLDILAAHSSYFVGSRWGNPSLVEYEVLSLATGAGAVYGILEKRDAATGRRVRMALVIVVQRRSQNGRCEFAWKEMTEFEGPTACGMSARMFAKLSPLEDIEPDPERRSYAEGWRARVRQAQDRRGVLSVLVAGTRLRFASMLCFRVGNADVRTSRFKVKEAGRKLRFIALAEDSGAELFVCRLSRNALTDVDWAVEA